jgi:phosphate transport system permease protein
LPIAIYKWTEEADQDFHHVAAAGIVVLLFVLVAMSAGAVVLRHRFGKRIRW